MNANHSFPSIPLVFWLLILLGGVSKAGGGTTIFVSSDLNQLFERDGKIIAGGSFTNVNGVFRQGLARLKPDGSLDSGFLPRFGDNNRNAFFSINQLALQEDGKLLIGGRIDGSPLFARLNPDGSFDRSFNPGGNQPRTELPWAGRGFRLIADGRVLVWSGDSLNETMYPAIWRLKADGTVDDTFPTLAPAGPKDYWSGWFVQRDGTILITHVIPSDSNRWGRHGCLRYHPDGTFDPIFSDRAELDSTREGSSPLAIQPDGKVIIAMFGFWPQYNLQRLNPDGTIDRSFSRQTYVRGTGPLLPLADGQLLVSGYPFSSYGLGHVPGVYRLRGDEKLDRFVSIPKLADGALHLLYNAHPGKAYSLQVSSDLMNWLPLRTDTAAGFTLEIEDADAANFPRRFYRARLVNP